MRCAVGLLIAMVASGCSGLQCKTDVLHVPEPVEIERHVYVAIDEALTTQHHIATGTVGECLTVAAARGRELRKCNADKAAIRAVQGSLQSEPQETQR